MKILLVQGSQGNTRAEWCRVVFLYQTVQEIWTKLASLSEVGA